MHCDPAMNFKSPGRQHKPQPSLFTTSLECSPDHLIFFLPTVHCIALNYYLIVCVHSGEKLSAGEMELLAGHKGCGQCPATHNHGGGCALVQHCGVTHQGHSQPYATAVHQGCQRVATALRVLYLLFLVSNMLVIHALNDCLLA